MEILVRDATLEDAEVIGRKLRAIDVRELQASCGIPPVEAMRLSIRYSTPMCKVAFLGDDPVCIFGVAPVKDLPNVGAPWLLATDLLYESNVTERFKKECLYWIDEMNKLFPLLVNFVDLRNEKAIQWLKKCGFRFVRIHEKYGVEQRPFWEFMKIRGDEPCVNLPL